LLLFCLGTTLLTFSGHFMLYVDEHPQISDVIELPRAMRILRLISGKLYTSDAACLSVCRSLFQLLSVCLSVTTCN
jgi:hypothetical protein